ncbi:glycosyltransferase family 4 protein [Helicobacter sp.]|uniref:glycosyltransferase family 4 protein n=1 Tax=Helicobacter sp. TaxID=218 RepID=UPI0019A4D97E|nr:glycosyltransferase family 4 protein [Helicobacter sp.]MBD5164676.1 glycosyltransferase family 4 protein [Helicobacter sp.]
MNKHIKIIRGVTVSRSVGFFTGLIPELRELGCEVVAVSSDGPELSRVSEAGGRVVTVEMERHISPLKDLKSLWRMTRVLRKEKPDMVHSMTPKAGLICMMAGKLAGVPVRVHTFTGLVFPTSIGLKRRILMATDWLTCACATHVIPEGEGVKRDLLDNGITKKPIKVLGYGNCRGIDLERFSRSEEVMAKAEEIKDPSVFTFISIGRLVGDKGINEMVAAFSRLNKENPATRLILVGAYEPDLDPIKPETQKEIENNPAIQAVGVQRDVRPWLAASDCAVLASYREGFPNVVIEAGAMGLPQIVTDINGANEIIIDGKNGTIIPSKDTEALYRAMKRFTENPEMIKSMAGEARALIASRYEQGYVRQCLKNFYKEILPKLR